VSSNFGRLPAISCNLVREVEAIEYSLSGFISGKKPLIVSSKL